MNNTIGLIMCTWKRVDYFKKTLKLLCKQTNKNFIFYVVNNNINIKNKINLVAGQYRNKLSIVVIHNNINRGGFGRFEVAKTLVDKHEIIIFIDDDQIFTNEMIDIFYKNYESNAIKSRWAFRFDNSYCYRERVIEQDKCVDYCGTGGMVLPSKIFLCKELYEIPEKYFFIEDLWLCFVANYYLDMKLKSIGNPDDFINQITDGNDQTTIERFYLKDEFLKYLRDIRGWAVKY